MSLDFDSFSEVLSYYGLGKPVAVNHLYSDQDSDNYKVKVRSSLFSGVSSFLLRKYVSHHVSQLRLSNSILLNLSKQSSVPVATPLVTKHDDTVVSSESSHYSLFHINSHFSELTYPPATIAPKDSVAAARTLASFHKEVSHLPPHEVFESQCFKYDDIAGVFQLQDVISRHVPRSDTDESLLAAFPAIHEHFQDYLNDLKYVRRRSDLQLVHGRFTPRSLVFHDKGVASLLDTEGIRFDYPEYDVVSALPRFIRSNDTRSRFDLEAMERFLTAYLSMNPSVNLKPREAIAFLRHSRLRTLARAVKDHSVKTPSSEVSGIVSGCIADLDEIKQRESAIISSFSKTGYLSERSGD